MTSLPDQLPTPEFSRQIKLSEIGSAPLHDSLTADEEECRALARRFGLPEISNISADYLLQSEEERINFTGTLSANLQQYCTISGQAFSVIVKDQFNIAFVEKIAPVSSEEEIELTEEDCDVIEYDHARIDIGEAIAQTLYLALDPYPRGPDAEGFAEKNGLKSEAEAGPFGALAALKDKLG